MVFIAGCFSPLHGCAAVRLLKQKAADERNNQDIIKSLVMGCDCDGKATENCSHAQSHMYVKYVRLELKTYAHHRADRYIVSKADVVAIHLQYPC